uniref:Chromo domain-containing protein n=1 Tax=Chenopodium quinoa TaxID=63459 RepID=A0A803L204_CHEQI
MIKVSRGYSWAIRQGKKNFRREYFVLWKGKPKSDANWERVKTLWQHEDVVKTYLDSLTGTSDSLGGGGLSQPKTGARAPAANMSMVSRQPRDKAITSPECELPPIVLGLPSNPQPGPARAGHYKKARTSGEATRQQQQRQLLWRGAADVSRRLLSCRSACYRGAVPPP